MPETIGSLSNSEEKMYYSVLCYVIILKEAKSQRAIRCEQTSSVSTIKVKVTGRPDRPFLNPILLAILNNSIIHADCPIELILLSPVLSHGLPRN